MIPHRNPHTRGTMAERSPVPPVSPTNVDWDQLRIFYAVVEAKSFTRAGRSLDLSQSAVSRQIGALEKSLQVSLFHRHAQGLVLTESGENFYKTVAAMYERMAMGLSQINEYRETPKGPLKITTSVAFGSAWLTSRMNKFHALYPDIAISLLLADNVELDLSLRQADVAIRFAKQTQPNLIQRHLITYQYHVFASREYLDRRGVPQTPADLDRHEIIVYGDELPAPVADLNWLLQAGATGRREPALRVSSVYAIFKAIQSGLGIGALPHYLSEDAPNLVEVLPELEGPRMDAYLVYPEELRYSRRIAAVRDFLLAEGREESKRVRARASLPVSTADTP
jgi:DNA-binding transcriptional LysR family regulator